MLDIYVSYIYFNCSSSMSSSSLALSMVVVVVVVVSGYHQYISSTISSL